MSAPKMRAVTAMYRWSVLGRVLAASLGGYLLASALSALVALALPWLLGISRAEGVLAASLLSFVLYTCIALWVFRARSVWRTWCVLAAVGLVAGVGIMGLQ